MTPYWEDGCSHFILDTYIGSFSIDEEKYDVFTYEKSNKTHICIRYGNEDSEYLSPGSVRQTQKIIHDNPDLVVYTTALSMVLNKTKKK